MFFFSIDLLYNMTWREMAAYILPWSPTSSPKYLLPVRQLEPINTPLVCGAWVSGQCTWQGVRCWAQTSHFCFGSRPESVLIGGTDVSIAKRRRWISISQISLQSRTTLKLTKFKKETCFFFFFLRTYFKLRKIGLFYILTVISKHSLISKNCLRL